MKTLCLLLAGSALVLFSCTKTSITAPANSTTDLSANTAAASLPSKTATQLLTAHPWKYNAYYFHYTNQQSKGDAEYVRGASGNLVDLDNTGFTFKKDGTFKEVSDGYLYPGTWYFTDAADTAFVMKFSYGSTDNNSILRLTSSQLNYTHFSGYHNNVYTELIPAAR